VVGAGGIPGIVVVVVVVVVVVLSDTLGSESESDLMTFKYTGTKTTANTAPTSKNANKGFFHVDVTTPVADSRDADTIKGHLYSLSGFELKDLYGAAFTATCVFNPMVVFVFEFVFVTVFVFVCEVQYTRRQTLSCFY
jgi:hypothetical protein